MISPDFLVAIEKPYNTSKLSLQCGSQNFKSDSPFLLNALILNVTLTVHICIVSKQTEIRN